MERTRTIALTGLALTLAMASPARADLLDSAAGSGSVVIAAASAPGAPPSPASPGGAATPQRRARATRHHAPSRSPSPHRTPATPHRVPAADRAPVASAPRLAAAPGAPTRPAVRVGMDLSPLLLAFALAAALAGATRAVRREFSTG